MAEVAPIRASVSHVVIDDGHEEAEVILIEDTFVLLVYQRKALGEARTSPRVEGAALKFDNRIGSSRTLLLV